ncbi:hypothetical protein [Streptomyces sp. NPDC058741]
MLAAAQQRVELANRLVTGFLRVIEQSVAPADLVECALCGAHRLLEVPQ